MSDLPLYLHLIGAATWLGGLVWLAFSTVIAARTLPREQFRLLVRRLGRAFGVMSLAAWLLIGATGFGFAIQRGWPRLAIAKAGLGALVLAAAAAHVATGMRAGSPVALAISRTLSVFMFVATLVLYWIGLKLAG
jgi:hypothetical protein